MVTVMWADFMVNFTQKKMHGGGVRVIEFLKLMGIKIL